MHGTGELATATRYLPNTFIGANHSAGCTHAQALCRFKACRLHTASKLVPWTRGCCCLMEAVCRRPMLAGWLLPLFTVFIPMTILYCFCFRSLVVVVVVWARFDKFPC